MKIYLKRVFWLAVVILGVATHAASSPIVPQFYKVKVQLADGRLIEGYSWGVSWIGGAAMQERKVKRVILSIEDEKVTAAFTFFGDDKPVVHKETTKDPEGRARTFAISPDYEVFRKDINFY